MMKKDQEETEKIVFAYSGLHEASVLDQNVRFQKALDNVRKEMETLNMNRGGSNTSGFVFENLHVADKNQSNLMSGSQDVLHVIDDNGIADFSVTDAAGNVSYQQAKMGYHGSNKYQITKEKYGDQTLVIDKGNKDLAEYGRRVGLNVEESGISKETADNLTAVMKTEGELRSSIGLSNTAPVTANLYAAAEQLKYAHGAGVKAAKGGAAFAAGVSFGKNMYEFMEGNKDLQEVVLETGKDAVVAAGTSYAAGGISYLASGALANTALGGIAAQAAGVVASTEIGATIISLGPVFATMSAAVGPMFLVGMVIGTGYAVVKSIAAHQSRYQQRISQVNAALDQVLSCMKKAYDELDQEIKNTYDFWDQTFDKGFAGMMEAVKKNDFAGFSQGLDTVLSVFDRSVMFRNMEEFDTFFFDDDAVLTL